MKIRIVTLFPEFFSGPLSTGLIDRAVKSNILEFELINLREYTEGKERCDDYPYGGGSGMVLKPEPLFRAVTRPKGEGSRIILTTPSGSLLTQERVKTLSREKDLCIICGHYEGVDQRAIELLVDEEISVGDYVLSGGEFAALIITDTVVRYIPGFMSNPESLTEESFEDSLLEYPQWTRPPVFMGREVPGVLLNGNHAQIAAWRMDQRIERTRRVRPDLYEKYITKFNPGGKKNDTAERRKGTDQDPKHD